MSDRTTVRIDPANGTTVQIDAETIAVISEKTTVVGTTAAGPQGPAGPTGPTGPLAIYVGPTPPVNTALLWVDTSV